MTLLSFRQEDPRKPPCIRRNARDVGDALNWICTNGFVTDVLNCRLLNVCNIRDRLIFTLSHGVHCTMSSSLLVKSQEIVDCLEPHTVWHQEENFLLSASSFTARHVVSTIHRRACPNPTLPSILRHCVVAYCICTSQTKYFTVDAIVNALSILHLGARCPSVESTIHRLYTWSVLQFVVR